MGCNHERFKAVGDRLFCLDCGVELPLEMLTGGQNQGKKPPADVQEDKPRRRQQREKRPQRKPNNSIVE